MGYNDSYENSGAMRQKDLVLAPNEFCFLQSKTNGVIKTHTGPIMMTISQQEALVVFDTKSKQFREVQNFDQAKQLFISAPENWYVILKNPTENGVYPEVGKSMIAPELKVGEKVNIRGPVSFSLFPGQMAKVIRGHALRTNQYLLARVYEANAASKSTGEMRDTEGNIINTKETYVNGQILVIKGTEVSFYIPPTGIEVVPVNNDPKKGYVREAVTLERLEYCILKDEDGNKRYVHGPEVVFPKATETFVTSPTGGFIFRAIELSKISGIYAKVIAEYKDEDGTVHPVGEELFITGDDQMIYYPRPEHAIISYDNKIMHHAIAIPEGEGRYIMNRMTGEITTVRGPKMYLPDPRTEVVVKRKLTPSQCELWFPGNRDALLYNQGLTEKAVEKSMKQADTDCLFAFSTSYSDSATMANLEAKANISRGTSYTKPRTITLDNKFEGVVSMDIWTGYAVNVVSKDGTREVVCGPKTILLDYDQTLEVLQMSTGKPKTDANLIKTVYLRHENNKVSDMITIETKDFVRATVKVSYCVDFDPKYMDKWFAVENYVKYLCDRQRALIKRAAKEYTIEEFYQNYSDIVRNIAIDVCPEGVAKEHPGRFFAENGMYVHDCEVLSIDVEAEIADMLEEHQHEMVRKALKVADAERRLALISALAEAEKSEQELRNQQLLNKMTLQREEAMKKLEIQSEVNRVQEAEKQAAKQAELNMQVVLDAISAADRARKDADFKQTMDHEATELAQREAHAEKMAAIDKAKSEAYAETVAKIMASISPELVAAMESRANADVVAAIEHAVAPYAIAGENETVTDVAQRLVKGTAFEDVFKQFGNK